MDVEVINPGPARLIRAIIDELRIIETINGMVRWDQKQWKLSPGELIASLIIAFFAQRRPLYQVWDFYTEQDIELLFGRPDLTPEDFTDDSLGRALDRLQEADFTKIYGNIIVFAKQVYALQTRCCHADTTSLVVYGAYDNPDQELVDYGFSKDKRFDLKQIKSGICANSDGIPIYGEPINGNKDDKTWNKELLQKFSTAILAEFQSLLVCDSQLVTGENLELIHQNGIRFISRLPDTFKVGEVLKQKAWLQNVWVDVGPLSTSKNAASYRIQEFQDDIDDRIYRFIVVRSSSLDRRKEKSLKNRIEKEKIALTKSINELNKLDFVCEPDAQRAWDAWLKKNPAKYHLVSNSLVQESVQERRAQRGRPKANADKPPSKTVYRIQACLVGENNEAIQKAYELERTFILISNDFDISAEEVLRNYKDQYKVEQKFGFLKDPQYVGPLFMKKEERLIALHHVLLMTLLVYSLFQLRVRRTLKTEGHPFVIAGTYKTFTPKAKSILEYVKKLCILRIKTPTGTIRQLPANVTSNAKKVIALAGFDVSIYITPPMPPPFYD